MQAVMETTFDLVYLISVITIGILMVRASSGKSRQFTIFGWMAIILGGGDSFHLIPRVIALCTTGLDHYTAVLGVSALLCVAGALSDQAAQEPDRDRISSGRGEDRTLSSAAEPVDSGKSA